MVHTDQMGRKVTLPHWPPKRIVSLVPSQTEFLADLGLENEVVGITKFCIHPAEWFQNKKRVGGTKTIDFQKVEALKPDLIIGNKEENEQGQIEYLAQKFPVWMSDIGTLEEALDMMRLLGQLVGKAEKAAALAAEVENRFLQLPKVMGARPKVAYLIWRKPYMAAARNTFIDNMLLHAGYDNVFAGLSRYPEVSAEQLRAARPDYIFLSSEPYPFAEKHFPALREICPDAQVRLVDGELFSWYGSRLLLAPGYYVSLGLR